jgi:curved DNA-binding protein CbpA
MNPFIVLNLPYDCSDEDVRGSYQKLLRSHSPERHPEQFQVIQEAYQALINESARWNWRLFNTKKDQRSPVEALAEFAHLPGRSHPPGDLAFRQLLTACTAAALRDLTKNQNS